MAAHGILADPAGRVEGLHIDSLSAVDAQIDETGMRDTVERLIMDEMERMANEERITAESYLNGTRFETAPGLGTSLVRVELERMQRGDPPEARMDLSGYSAVSAPAGTAGATEWESALRRSQIALETQSLRTINLELAAKYGVDAWKGGVEGIEKVVGGARVRLAELEARASRIDAGRASAQAPHSARLSTLSKRYGDTLEGNFSAALACAAVEREVKRQRQ